MTTGSEIVRSLREEPAVKAALAAIDAGWCRDLGQYVAGLPKVGQQLSPKAIKDSVWGMIHLEGYEVLVVDSPPFQRLRRVKQLGTTYFTFPTADYSRFEHALGVMHQATRMVDAISSRSQQPQPLMHAKRAVRLACLLHDIGHLPLSHLSERHFTEHPDSTVSAAHEQIDEALEVHSQLSEILSFLLIQSDRFRSFLVHHCKYVDPDIDDASLAILGSPPPGRGFLKQLISNVIDADKLDYMFRDSRYTSVPLPVDLDRLLYKIKLLPQEATTEAGRHAGGYLAIDLGGSHLVEDLIIARRILARQIYRHHKTLAAEQLVLRLLALTKPALLDVIAKDDAFFLPEYTGSAVLANAGTDLEEAKLVVDELRFRRLPRRAFARSFALLPRVSVQPGKPEIAQHQRLAELTLAQDLRLIDKRTALERATLTQFNDLCAQIGRSAGGVTRVYFDPSEGSKSPAVELFLQRPDGTVQLYEQFAASAAAFAHSPEEFNYVFYSGAPDAAPLIHIATELVLFERYGLTYGRGSADHAKIDLVAIEALKREIERKAPDFFSNRAQLRPRNGYARALERASQVTTVYENIKTFRDGISRDDIQSFLDQFPELLVPPALDMLANVQLVSNSAAAREIMVLLQGEGAQNWPLVPLTRLGQSSSVMAYHLRQSKGNIKELNEALGSGATQIVLFEDSLLTGKQASSILQSWFGLTPESPDDAVPELPRETQAWLKETELVFLFAVGTEQGVAALRECCDRLGLKLRARTSGAAILVAKATRRFADLGSGKDKLQKFLGDVGKSLLETTKGREKPEKWTPELCEKRGLSYADDAGLTIFENNVPTSTVTALWCDGGQYRNVKWIPLFPRIDSDAAAAALEIEGLRQIKSEGLISSASNPAAPTPEHQLSSRTFWSSLMSPLRRWWPGT